jgi:hypothetical protein
MRQASLTRVASDVCPPDQLTPPTGAPSSSKMTVGTGFLVRPWPIRLRYSTTTATATTILVYVW